MDPVRVDAGDLSATIASGTRYPTPADDFDVSVVVGDRVRLIFRHGAKPGRSPSEVRQPTSVSFADPAEALRVGQALIAAAFRAERRRAPHTDRAANGRVGA